MISGSETPTRTREPKTGHPLAGWSIVLFCIALMFIAGTVSGAENSGQSIVANRMINTPTAVTTTVPVYQAVRAPVTLVPVVSATTIPPVYRKLPVTEVVTMPPKTASYTFSGSVRERRYAAGVDINASTLFTYYPLVNHKLLLLGEGKDYIGETWTNGNGDYSLTVKMDQKNSSYAYYYLVQETGGIKSLWIDVQSIGGVPRSNAAPSFWISYTAPLAGKTGSGNNFFFVTQYGTPTMNDEWISGSAMTSSLVCSAPGNSVELLGSTGNVTEGTIVRFAIFNSTHETADFLPAGGLYIGETKVRKDGSWNFSWNGMAAGHTFLPGHDYLIRVQLSEMNYIKIGILCEYAGGQYSSLPENMTLSVPASNSASLPENITLSAPVERSHPGEGLPLPAPTGTTEAAGQNPQPLNTNAAGNSDPVGSILNFFSGLFGGKK